jgi:hypothetical protein
MLPAILTPNEATLTFGPPIEFHQEGVEGPGREATAREALHAATARIQQAVDELRRRPRLRL